MLRYTTLISHDDVNHFCDLYFTRRITRIRDDMSQYTKCGNMCLIKLHTYCEKNMAVEEITTTNYYYQNTWYETDNRESISLLERQYQRAANMCFFLGPIFVN